tara:strand:+ start:1821 stop:1925 length:105 start_codon:yes stop_codon:yes gene_type:complete
VLGLGLEMRLFEQFAQEPVAVGAVVAVEEVVSGH